MSRFFTQRLAALSPYTPGEQPRDMQYVKLNTNESPYPPCPEVIEAAGFDANVRGETLSIPEFARIANEIVRRKNHD